MVCFLSVRTCDRLNYQKGQEKFLKFFALLKKEFKLSGFYQIESTNNFPSDCGLASSASSFAALTQCAHDVYLAESSLKAKPYTAKNYQNYRKKDRVHHVAHFFHLGVCGMIVDC